MRQYLLPESGRFFKVNMHSHSTLSDGNQTPEQLKEAYKAAGYSAIAFTEHEVMLDLSYLNDEDFIAITSFEYDVSDRANPPFVFYEGKPHNFSHYQCVHMNLYAKDPHDVAMVCYNPKYLGGRYAEYTDKITYVGEPNFEREFTLESINGVVKAAHERGMLVVYNHPNWSLNTYPLYSRLEGFDGIEIVNGASDRSSDMDYTPYVYDQMARAGHRMMCVGGDDNHSPSHFFQAWTMVKADSLTYDNLFGALKKGDCYASTGPEIYDLYVEDGKVTIHCSPANGVFMSTAGRRKAAKLSEHDQPLITECTFALDPEDYFFRITVRDTSGHRANTRIYYLDELTATADEASES